ncbi:hypothetical protein [Candidatus Allofournierella merdipullorum]|uniref:hypothetical protein n=1 Tax=Candidatus Allofournierella merdipullorum TaxID=2838595 RepID=UPI003AB68CC1
MEETMAAAPQQVQKKTGFWKTMLETLKTSLAPTAIMAVFWLVLSWAKAAGIQWAILWPFQFLTGALAGMEGSALGGTIGKAILLVCFNSLFRGLLMHRKWDGRRRDNVKSELKAQTKAQLFARIPQYSNLKLLWKDRSPHMLAAGLWGSAAALAAYPFLTGDGSAVNSMVCVALFLTIGGQIARQRGLLITLLNILLAKKALRTVNRGVIDRVFAGFAVGMAAAVPLSLTKNLSVTFLWPLLARGLPILLALLGIFCLVRPRLAAAKAKKAAAAAGGGEAQGK